MFIDGVSNSGTYVTVVKYLTNLSAVTKVQLLDVTPTGIKLRVTSMGGLLQLMHAINLDHKLIKSAKTETTDPNINLTYKWAENAS